MNPQIDPTRATPVGTWMALLSLLAAAVYANTLGHGFVWDDNTIVLGDPMIRSLASVPSFFQRSYWGEADPEFKLYRPLVQATLAVDWAIGGGSAVPFHATNLLLHVLATLLAFFLFRELRDDLPWAFFAAAFFAVHPVHTDAVDSIVQRAEVLGAIGVMGGFLAAMRGRWVLLGIAAAVGVLSKETAATLPLLILAWHLLGDRARRPRWPAYAVSIGVLALYGVARWRVLGDVTVTHAAFGDAPLGERWLTMSCVFRDYVRLLAVPWPLCADYAVNVNPSTRVTSASDPRFLAAAVVLGVVAVAWCVSAVRRRAWVFWGAWIAVALLPVSNLLVPIGAIQAERFLYLPSVGACALLGWACARPQVGRAGLVVVGLFAMLTLLRNPVWRDDESLLDARMEDAPQNPWPYFRSAQRLAQRGELAKARERLDEALEAMPEHHDARRLRVQVLFASKEYAAAAEDQEALLRVRPDSKQGWANLAFAYACLGDREKVDETLDRMGRAGHPADEALRKELERLLAGAGG